MFSKTIIVIICLSIPIILKAKDIDWELTVVTGGEIYPSWVLGTAVLDRSFVKKENENIHGNSLSSLCISVTAPQDGSIIDVEIEGSSYLNKSSFSTTLKTEGKRYFIFPPLSFDYEKLAKVRQSQPISLKAKITIDGMLQGQKNITLVVRSATDCLLSYQNVFGNKIKTSYLLAAYVNESHASIDRFLSDALDSMAMDKFRGYDGSPESVLKEIEALWYVFKDLGFRYSNITTPSGAELKAISQHIRLLSDSVKTSQANCVEGSVLFASIFRKLGLQTFLVLIPGHCLVSVCLEKEGKNIIFLETTVVDKHSFETGLQLGGEVYNRHKDKFGFLKQGFSEVPEYLLLDIGKARAAGILSLPDEGS